jgi:hypothetical protein
MTIRDKLMWTLPYSTPQKAGVILYGLLIGALMVPVTAIGCFLLGAILLLVMHLMHLADRDAGGAFVLAECILYGFYIGIPIGLVVCWKVCRSRLRESKPE